MVMIMTCYKFSGKGGGIISTCSHTREGNGVLADEIVTDEFIVEDDESDERHIGVVDVELETFLEDGTVAFVGDRSCFLFCSIVQPFELSMLTVQWDQLMELKSIPVWFLEDYIYLSRISIL